MAAEAADPLAALGWGQPSQGDIYRWLGVLKARSQWEHPFPIFFVYDICMYMCVTMSVCPLCVSMHVEARGDHRMDSSVFLHLIFWDRVTLLNLRLTSS